MATSSQLVAAISFGTLGLVYYRYHYPNASQPLPPSPPKHVLFGNIKDIPKYYEWIKYAEWSKKLGSDVISFSALGNTIIILNSHRSIMDLVDKKAIYADRPSAPMVTDERLMNLGGLVTINRYGPRWRQLRKGIQLHMQESAIPNYWPAQIAAARNLMVKLLDHGDRSFYKDLQHWSASSILAGTYGYRLPEDGTSDPLLQQMHDLVVMFAQGSGVQFLVNLFPVLKYIPDWMPGAHFKKFARKARELKNVAIEAPFEWVKNEMAKGTALPSYVSRSLSEGDFGDDEEPDVSKRRDLLSFEEVTRDNAGVMYGAGFDTTLIAMTTFIIAMQLYPKVQARAREEVLSVLDPTTRLPDPTNVMKLPYLSRVLKESMRWIPVLPVSVAHATMELDEYNGYAIPARSIVLPNVWAVTRDESIYPNPETFDPDRFLDPSVPSNHAFGYGRRRCPGLHFANSNLLIAFAYILTVFEIDKGVNEDGTVIEPRPLMKKDPEFRADGLKCTLKARDPSLLDELKQE